MKNVMYRRQSNPPTSHYRQQFEQENFFYPQPIISASYLGSNAVLEKAHFIDPSFYYPQVMCSGRLNKSTINVPLGNSILSNNILNNSYLQPSFIKNIYNQYTAAPVHVNPVMGYTTFAKP